MRKKQFLQFRRAMATLLAVAMIGQNTVMTTAENYVADNTAVVAEEQAQEPGVQVEESASPAVCRNTSGTGGAGGGRDTSGTVGGAGWQKHQRGTSGAGSGRDTS